MCPACIATAAWIATGTVSAGGITAFFIKRLQQHKSLENDQSDQPDSKVKGRLKVTEESPGYNRR